MQRRKTFHSVLFAINRDSLCVCVSVRDGKMCATVSSAAAVRAAAIHSATKIIITEVVVLVDFSVHVYVCGVCVHFVVVSLVRLFVYVCGWGSVCESPYMCEQKKSTDSITTMWIEFIVCHFCNMIHENSFEYISFYKMQMETNLFSYEMCTFDNEIPAHTAYITTSLGPQKLKK